MKGRASEVSVMPVWSRRQVFMSMGLTSRGYDYGKGGILGKGYDYG